MYVPLTSAEMITSLTYYLAATQTTQTATIPVLAQVPEGVVERQAHLHLRRRTGQDPARERPQGQERARSRRGLGATGEEAQGARAREGEEEGRERGQTRGALEG